MYKQSQSGVILVWALLILLLCMSGVFLFMQKQALHLRSSRYFTERIQLERLLQKSLDCSLNKLQRLEPLSELRVLLKTTQQTPDCHITSNKVEISSQVDWCGASLIDSELLSIKLVIQAQAKSKKIAEAWLMVIPNEWAKSEQWLMLMDQQANAEICEHLFS